MWSNLSKGKKMAVRVPKRSNTDLLSVLALWALDMIDDRIGKEVRDERRETEFTIDLVERVSHEHCFRRLWTQLTAIGVHACVSHSWEIFISWLGHAKDGTARRGIVYAVLYKHSVNLVPIYNCVQSSTQIINIFIIFSNKWQTEIIQWISSRVKLVINDELTDYFPRNDFRAHFSS